VARVSRRVIVGMLFATVPGLLMIPVFYVSVRRVFGDKLEKVSEKRPITMRTTGSKRSKSKHPSRCEPPWTGQQMRRTKESARDA
jgi:hypothetical protein